MERVASGSGRGSSDPSFMESLARGLSVIRAFGRGRTRLSGTEVASRTGLSRAAARRCLHTLTVLGYARVADGLYELTPAVLTLGQAYLGSASLAGVAQPILEQVAESLQEAVGVALLDGHDIVFVARAAARRILSVEISVGGRLPAACTASGRVLVAHEDEENRERWLARVALMAHTKRSIVDRDELRAEIDRVRKQGFAIVDQELELGLRSAAVPIIGVDGTALAALNVGVQAARVDGRSLQRELVPALKRAAAEIARRLGGE
jgi:IclR family pca regulon transcriptional regulator